MVIAINEEIFPLLLIQSVKFQKFKIKKKLNVFKLMQNL